MDIVLGLLLGTIVSWVVLLIVIPIAQKFADFSMPPWSEALWKLAVVAAAGSAVSIFLDPVNIWLSLLVGAGVFWIFMYKWFDIDMFGAMVIVFISSTLRSVIMIFMMGLFT